MNDEDKKDETPVEEPKEEPKTEEKPAEEAVDTAAEEKMLNRLAEKLVGLTTAATKKAEEKKEKIFETETKVVGMEPKVKFYRNKKGDWHYIGQSEAQHLGQWFKAWARFKKSHRPDHFDAMQKEYDILEKMAVVQKLEPLQVGVAAEGGNIVPTILYNKLVPLIEDLAMIRSRAMVLDATGVATLALPGIQTRPIVSWNAEAAQKATTSVQFSQLSLTPYILAGIIVVTQQLIDDSPFNVVQIVSQLLAEAIARAEDAAFASGTGTGQPTGIDTYTPAFTLSAGGALTWQHINQCFYGMPQGHRANATWLAHKDTLALLANLADTNNRPILDVGSAVTGGGLPTIRGNAVIENNDISNNTLYLVDLNYYWIAYSRGMSIDTADQATIRDNSLWERNEIAIRAEEKLDGELVTTRALATITALRT